MKKNDINTIIAKAKHEVTPNGCWHSAIYRNEGTVSPRVYIGGRRVKLYKVLFEYYEQKIPKGYNLCRRCGDIQCINPSHYKLFINGNNPRLQCIWEGIISRCYASQRPEYKNYGGRGIKVCDEWRSFKPFQEWALNHGYDDGLEIDRIDNNGDYTPQNCRFVTHGENNRNRRKRSNFNKNGYTAIEKTPSGKYYFRFMIDGKRMTNHKYYNTPKEAEIAKRGFVKEHNLFYYNE